MTTAAELPEDDLPDAPPEPPPKPIRTRTNRRCRTRPAARRRVLEAAAAAIPLGPAGAASGGARPRPGARSAGRAGALRTRRRAGRPAGLRRGMPRNGARLNLIETLRAAAPWQPLRRRERPRVRRRRAGSTCGGRLPHHALPPALRTTTIFVVDASGSSALNRLAEAKGAVELLLADCYVRRDQVALLAFRGRQRRAAAAADPFAGARQAQPRGLPGGGGTPLASRHRRRLAAGRFDRSAAATRRHWCC
jgi:magnesium chelatase subunit D